MRSPDRVEVKDCSQCNFTVTILQYLQSVSLCLNRYHNHHIHLKCSIYNLPVNTASFQGSQFSSIDCHSERIYCKYEHN